MTTLSFQVDSSALLKAKEAVDNLSSSVAKLNSAVKEEASTSSSTVKEVENLSKAKTKEAAANTNLVKGYSDVDKILRNLNNTYADMAQGSTKGESSVLNRLRNAGATAQQIAEATKMLENISSLNKNPFDASLGAIRSISKELELLQHRADLAANGITLSTKQLNEYSKISAEVSATLKTAGVDISQGEGLKQYNKLLEDSQQKYISYANQVNGNLVVEKNLQKALLDKQNASRNAQAAEERLFSTVAHLNDGLSSNVKLNERAALALGSYERNLRLAGITGEEAAKKIQKFRAAQEVVSAAEAERRGSFVARGISTQMGDVAVSLASGMNPLTVMIQQSDQVRSLIQQSGLEAAQMSGIMKQAFAGIITSFRDVGVAMSSFVIGGLQSMGKSFIDLTEKTLPFKATLSFLERKFPDTAGGIGAFTKSLAESRVVASLAGASIGAFAAALVALTVNLFQTAKANDSLRLSVITSGAALGKTSDELIALSENTLKAGSSVNELKGFFSALATEGLRANDSLSAIATSAQEFSSATGKSLEDIAKEYAAMQKDPVKALTELAIKTGQVDVATVELARKLSDAGMSAEAARVAIDALAIAHSNMAKKAKEELSAWSLVWIDIKSYISDVGTGLTNLANNSAIQKIVAFMKLGVSGLGAINEGKKDLGIITSLTASIEERKAAYERLQNLQSNFNKDNQQYFDILDGVKRATVDSTLATSKQVYQTERYNSATKDITASLKEKVKELTREEYISRKIQDLRRKAGTPILDPVTFAAARSKFGEEWDSANKKAKSSRGASSAVSKEDNYFAQTLERISDLNIKATQTTDANSKAQQLFLDIASSPLWAKFTEDQRVRVAQLIEEAHAIELSSNALKEQKKLREDILKIQTDYALSNQKDLDEINNKIALIGLTENEKTLLQAKLKVEQDRLATIQKINAEVAKSLATGNISVFDAEAQRISETNAANATAASHLEKLTAANQLLINQSQSFEAGWSEAFAKYRSELENTANVGAELFNTISNSFSNSFMSFINGTMTAKEAFRSFAASIVQEMLKIMAQQLAMKAIGGILGMFGFSGFGAGVDSLVKAGDLGSGWVAGATGLGWSDGGYTGVGGKYQPAGIVHKGEVVWSQQDVARAGGVSAVEAMRKGVGYSDGGLVTPAVANPAVNNIQNNQSTKIINVLDPTIVGSYLTTDEGERLIVNVMQKNQRVLTG